MRKSELKNGMMVEIRNGDLYLVVGDFMTRKFDYELLSSYDENMIHDIENSCDIMKVYAFENNVYDNNATTLEALFDREYLTLLWERKEREEHNLTEREVEVLEALQTLGFEWLAKDKDERLYAYGNKPKKLKSVWATVEFTITTPIDEDLFTFIEWEDKKPVSIKELLK